MIVFNDIARRDIGFGSDYNGWSSSPRLRKLGCSAPPKETVAEIILDHIARGIKEKRAALG